MSVTTLSIRATHHRRRRTVAWAAALALGTGALVGVGAGPAMAAEQCDTFAQSSVSGGWFVVQNNRWGSSTTQCVEPSARGFEITRAEGSNPTDGEPKGYPSIYAGCHYEVCTKHQRLPLTAKDVGTNRTTASITTAPGEWNASYDLWFDADPDASGQNRGTEVMIWINHQGSPQPIGSPQGKVTLDGASWTVWEGNQGWDVVSFVRDTPVTRVDLPLKPFVDESIARGKTESDDYLTSVQFGFEPWVGGEGLAVKDFSFTQR